jgi:D-alanine-D-alanine ligase-like ATP-grasp enzyme
MYGYNFEIFGLDLMFDDQGEIHLIEINDVPGIWSDDKDF